MLPRRRLIQAASAALLAPTLPVYSQSRLLGSDVRESELASMVDTAEAFRKKWNVPGLSVAIARAGIFQYQQAFGVTEYSGSQALSPTNIFRIASISKPITATAIFKLIETGHLDLNARVFGQGHLLGTEFGSHAYSDDVKRITVDHLLTHTAGGWGKRDDVMFSNAFMSQHDLISWVLDTRPLDNPPGTAFDYSNFGYCILGRVIERVARRPYSEFVKEAVLGPAAILDMGIANNVRTQRLPNEVVYFGQNGEDPYDINVQRMDSHGGWVASPSDLVSFVLSITGENGKPALLKPETVKEMIRPSPIAAGHAHGWNISGAGYWWHGGDLAGTGAILVRLKSGLCWAALINTRGDSTDVQLDDFMWSLVGQVKAWKADISG